MNHVSYKKLIPRVIVFFLKSKQLKQLGSTFYIVNLSRSSIIIKALKLCLALTRSFNIKMSAANTSFIMNSISSLCSTSNFVFFFSCILVIKSL